MKKTDQKKLLLHICCAPDATVVFERLRSEYDITGYFYNPNIHEEAEYQFRAEEIKRLAHEMDVPLEIGSYDSERWFELTKGMENLPEKGKRCTVCFQMRLEKSAQFATENNFDIFTTVLTVSPHKNAMLINKIGEELAEKHDIQFMESNFKKKDGFKRSLELSKSYNLYRQNYCGCRYSKR